LTLKVGITISIFFPTTNRFLGFSWVMSDGTP